MLWASRMVSKWHGGKATFYLTLVFRWFLIAIIDDV
jgi:hypothetical protein